MLVSLSSDSPTIKCSTRPSCGPSSRHETPPTPTLKAFNGEGVTSKQTKSPEDEMSRSDSSLRAGCNKTVDNISITVGF